MKTVEAGTISDETIIRITYPDYPQDIGECRWLGFRSYNDDPELLAEIADALAKGGTYTGGGGAAPIYRIEARRSDA